ncbi:OmpP1/FadL family transporter [Iodobacter ciconiae]|uniref:Transporter n=1 Tax=Iodobacter ciconiae TaxID=2496266 RepID=A0A3S8ZSS9_9NEIS|nr:OmpP1/FadL family transporter [Iodobacter ciconiae]AZN36547.1 transporter [Iodobacter ciconiae]
MSGTIRMAIRTLGVASLFLAGNGLASGYHFGTQSVSAQGVAISNAAEAEDATVLFYNPAGMTNLPGTNISGALIVVDPHISFSNMNATNSRGKTVTGNDGGTATGPVVVPQTYITHQVNEQLFVGLAMFVPFGDKTNFDDKWIGRYNGTDLELMTLAINPSVAYKINEQFSVGAGVTAQYMKARYKKMIDLGGKATVGGFSSPALDGSMDYEGDDWSYGFNLGATWKVDDTLRFGAAYRSSLSHTLEGDAKFTVPGVFPPGVAVGAKLLNSNGTVDLETPDSFSLNFYKKLNSQFALTGDWTHTWHSKFQDLILKTDAGFMADVEQKWRDTDRFSLGLSYQYSDPLKLRFGLAFDQSPADQAKYRIANLPDSDRIWFSTGFNYVIDKNMSVDVAYAYVDFKNTSMANKDGSNSVMTNADVSAYANVFGAQLNYRF